MTQGQFISIEGLEGAGKSTILQFIKRYLTTKKYPVLLTREPGGTPLSETIRQLLLHHHPSSSETIAPETELLLMFACRAQHLQECIVPAITAGTWVVSDRFIDASYAYQGGGRGLSKHYIAWLDTWIVNKHYPNLTLLLDIPPRLSNTRLITRGKQKDRIEQEDNHFFTQVRNSYLERAAMDTHRIKLIDVSQPLSLVEENILTILDIFTSQHQKD